MKTSHLLVAGAVGVGAIALLASKFNTNRNNTETSTDPDADLLQWNGDPGKIRYEIPNDLNLNGEVLRDFCGSLFSHIGVSRSAAFMAYLPDAIRKTFEDLADGDPEKVSETGINNARIWCIKWLIEDGRTHDIIMNWINSDYDVSNISLAELDYMAIVMEEHLPEDTLNHVYAMCDADKK